VGMKSVRFGDDLDRQLHAAAQLLGVADSELIREAVAARCREVLGSRLDVRLGDYVGGISGGGGRAAATGRNFADLLRQRQVQRP